MGSRAAGTQSTLIEHASISGGGLTPFTITQVQQQSLYNPGKLFYFFPTVLPYLGGICPQNSLRSLPVFIVFDLVKLMDAAMPTPFLLESSGIHSTINIKETWEVLLVQGFLNLCGYPDSPAGSSCSITWASNYEQEEVPVSRINNFREELHQHEQQGGCSALWLRLRCPHPHS